MRKGIKVINIATSVKYHLSHASEKTQSFGMDRHDGALAHDNFAVLGRRGGPPETFPVKTDHYALALCLEGSCNTTIGAFSSGIKAGTLHFVSPGQICSYKDVSPDLLLYIILFRKDFMSGSFIQESILDQLVDINPGVPPFFSLSETSYPLITGLFEKIDREYRVANTFYLQVIKLQIVELLYEMNRMCDNSAVHSNACINRQYQLVYHYKKMVNEYFLTTRTVQKYAEKLNVSAKYLGELVRDETGQSALEVIHDRIYQEAQHLLITSGNSIKEIAAELGFDTSSHFSRFFKNYSGFNPSEFKTNPV